MADVIPVVAMRVSRLKVRTAAFSTIPTRRARRIPEPIFDKGFRTWAKSFRLGSKRLNVSTFDEGIAVARAQETHRYRSSHEKRARKRLVKKRVHNAGRNQLQT